MLIERILGYFSEQAETLEKEIKFFGIVMAFNYPLYFLIWNKTGGDEWSLDLSLRVMATFLCIGLASKDYWAEKFIKFLPMYWYFSVIFCLPFFFTFMTLANHGSAIWLMNDISVVFFVLILNNVIPALFILLVGIIAAQLLFILLMPPFTFDLGTVSGYDVFWTYLAAVVIGGMFSYKRNAISDEKFRALKYLSRTIAHEMRTPLMGISAEARWLKKVMPTLLESYQIAIRNPEHSMAPIPSNFLESLPKVSDELEKTTRNAFTVIDMLLMNLKDNFLDIQNETCSMNECIKTALADYPFEEDDKPLVHLKEGEDFVFRGNELLLKHVLFNLLKNALFYVKQSANGKIFITTDQDDSFNILSFKDTGPGIAQEILPYIFDRFFSRTRNGTGIGLAFCKMVMVSLGGEIRCHSVKGEFTEFRLFFPMVKDEF
jgi:signal transduction histidine kinase